MHKFIVTLLLILIIFYIISSFEEKPKLNKKIFMSGNFEDMPPLDDESVHNNKIPKVKQESNNYTTLSEDPDIINRSTFSKDSCFYDYNIFYPELNIINQNRKIILDEFNKAISSDIWYNWINEQLTLIPLYNHGHFSEKVGILFPKTVEILKRIPKIVNVSFSKLSKQSQILPHKDWGVVSNNILRCHYGLIVPEKCGFIIENWVEFHENDKWLAGDISKTHTSFNKSNDDRHIILVDMERPKSIPVGDCKISINDDLAIFLGKFFNKQQLNDIKKYF